MLKSFTIASIAAAGVLVAGAASATGISTNTWYEFGFGGVGSSLENCPGCIPLTNPSATAPGDPAWTFTLTQPGTLFVTDAFSSGDQFELLDFGSVIGQTSAAVTGSSCASDLTCALSDPNFSSGSFLLAAGDHSITGAALASPFGAGAAAFIVNVSAVPLPAAAPMLLSALAALGGLGLWGRRRAA